MPSSPEKKTLITENQLHKMDTGSSQVQISILTHEIKQLSAHLKNNLKDIVCRRSLLAKVARRKRLQKYLAKN